MNDDDAAGSATEPAKPTTPQEWRVFLQTYCDLYLRIADERTRPHITTEEWRTRWLGRDPADDEDIAMAEERLGVRLPPTLRGFLYTSDGWAHPCNVEEVFGCGDIHLLRDTTYGQDLIEIYRRVWETGEDPFPVSLFERALVVADGDGFTWLLDPAQAGPDGEFPVYDFMPGEGHFWEFTDFGALFRENYERLAEEVADVERKDAKADDEAGEAEPPAGAAARAGHGTGSIAGNLTGEPLTWGGGAAMETNSLALPYE
ncbi:hypothetical protein GCM10027570_00660 [Streptomonospora sediminis]